MLMYTMIVYILLQECRGINLIVLPDRKMHVDKTRSGIKQKYFHQQGKKFTTNEPRRHWLHDKAILRQHDDLIAKQEEEQKDVNLKIKISTLVQQTLHDTETKVKSIQHLRTRYREESPYKAGFILSMVKKSRDVLNELFNVAVKHRNEWKALDQLKIFELIVHTNVDTTNLVRQLVEIHIQNVNNTNSADGKKRVVLL